MTPFTYHKPTNLVAAHALLVARPEAAALAGGMTLIPTLKQRLRDVSDLVDLSDIADLKGIMIDGDRLKIGAMTTHAEVADSRVVHNFSPALAVLAGQIGDPQVRNRGTIGGSLANGDPAADWPAAVLGLQATLHTGGGDIVADDFFTGMFSTALKPGELISAISFPKPKIAAYAKFRHPASGYAVAGVFVAQFADAVRVAVTGATACVTRWPAAEAALAHGFTVTNIAALAFTSDDLLGDIHASQDYRAHLVGVMLKRALATA